MVMTVIETLAWVVSAGLLGWMVFDAIRVGRNYDEEFLTTSVEGTDELFEPAAPVSGGKQ